MQFVFIKPEAYVPLAQGKHLASPVGEKYPGAHFSVEKQIVSKQKRLLGSVPNFQMSTTFFFLLFFLIDYYTSLEVIL